VGVEQQGGAVGTMALRLAYNVVAYALMGYVSGCEVCAQGVGGFCFLAAERRYGDKFL